MSFVFRKKLIEPNDMDAQAAKAMVQETAHILNQAVDFGISSNVIDTAMMQKLRNDVYVFSSCKTYAQLQDMSNQAGNVKSWNEFSREVAGLGKMYNEQYLEAEYIFATQSAQMSARWAEFETSGDRYLLQYRTAGDERVREEHAELADTTLPINDPFWSKYFPPNGWRCRCTTVQVRKGKYPESDAGKATEAGERATTQIGKNGQNRAEMFRFNPGQQKVVFPQHHPYYKLQSQIEQVINNISEAKNRYIAQSKVIYENLDSNWTKALFDENSGGFAAYHDRHKFDPVNGIREKEVAKILAQKGYNVILLEEPYGKKQFDALVNGVPTEIKIMSGNRNIVHRAKQAVKQGADRVVYDVRFDNHQTLLRELNNVKKSVPEIKEIWYVWGGKMTKYE